MTDPTPGEALRELNARLQDLQFVAADGGWEYEQANTLYGKFLKTYGALIREVLVAVSSNGQETGFSPQQSEFDSPHRYQGAALPPEGRSLQHGRDCPKVPHVGGGYLHGADDDHCYEVDGVAYCGRCHAWLESSFAAPEGRPQADDQVQRAMQFGQRRGAWTFQQAWAAWLKQESDAEKSNQNKVRPPSDAEGRPPTDPPDPVTSATWDGQPLTKVRTSRVHLPTVPTEPPA